MPWGKAGIVDRVVRMSLSLESCASVEPALGEELADEGVVGPVEAEAEDLIDPIP